MSIANYFPIWDKLSQEHRRQIEELADLRTVSAGTVVHDGSPNCLGLLLVRTGQLRAYMLSEEGREVTISRFFDMDICLFSASCVMSSMQFDVMIEAEKDTQVWVIPACLFQNIMNASIALSNYARDLISNHFSEVMWLMEQIMWKSFDKRLAAFLLEESAVEDTVLLKITHEKIANHMGTAREVVTRMLRYFQNEGMVQLQRGSIRLTDRRRLEQLKNT